MRQHTVPPAVAFGLPAVLLLLLAACGSPGGSSGTPPTHRPTPRPARTTASPPTGPASSIARIVHVLDPGGYLDGLALTGTTLWATDLDGNRVVRVDADSRKVLGTVPLADGPLSIVADGDTVWVAAYNGDTVTHLNSTGKVIATVHTPSQAPCGLALVGHLLWVVDQSDGAGVVVDTSSARVVHALHTKAAAGFATYAFGSVWVGDFEGTSGTVYRLPVEASGSAASVRTGLAPIGMTAGDGSLWVTNAKADTVSRVDPQTMHVTATIKLPGSGPTGVLVTPAGVWVSGYLTNALYLIDPSTNAVQGKLAMPGSAQNLVSVGDHIWVTTATGQLVEVAPTR